MSEYVTLSQGGAQIVLHTAQGERPRLLYAGPQLDGAQAVDFAALASRRHAPGGPEQPINASLLCPIGTGFPGPPGLEAHREGTGWAIDLRIANVSKSEDGFTILTRDIQFKIEAEHTIVIDPSNGVMTTSTNLTNKGETALTLNWCSVVCLPIDPRLSRITSFTGKWAGEFQTELADFGCGSFVRENRAGRTSHDSYPGLYFGSETTSEAHGPAMAATLGWSGNHRLRIDHLADGTQMLQAGELLLPGEVILAPGQSYTTPSLHLCWSDHGYGDITRRLHRHVRTMVAHQRPRPVHYNTWEAVYFDHSPEKLVALANAAAEVGAERFVLDDGWFGARRNDRAGLGDWTVSQDVYPDGLKPLADHVRDLGMEFGLWFEPEMVNPDSDLYRAHPDWVLQAEGAEPIASRHQLPLDMTRREVTDYLFKQIDALVRELGIAYIKWDMNRDLQHPGDARGRPAVHRQTHAVYALMERLLAAHPALEIESCSSGGARADFGVLRHTKRVWTSDNNDARQRYPIMRGAAHFLPLSVLGNHVGPRKCHITGRRFDMQFRAGTAMFGSMGMELDLASESDADRAVLARAIALHKRHRELLHSGDYIRLDTQPHISGIGVTDEAKNEALFQVAILGQHPAPHPRRIRFSGLDPRKRYRVACCWPEFLSAEMPAFAGSALMEYGLQLPQTYPDTCLIYHLEADT